MISLIAMLPLFFSSFAGVCKAETAPPAKQSDSAKTMSKEIVITLTKMPDGVTGILSTIYIDATPIQVWKVLTDYNNLKRYIPRMVESDLVEDKGNLKVIGLTGEFKLLLFKKTHKLAINMHETFPIKIDYEKISGDFEVYRGVWTLQKQPSKGTLLTYECEIKPSFFAPDFIFQSTLKKDIVEGMRALRTEAERMPAD
jgi:ribosome-associated toxin RatA of RatAB toxin-antitoxin module